MEKQFKEALAALNSEQRQAVETIDGPVLVIAGPGTGKTQLISTRVGYILQKTDTPADAILLLTYTDAGAAAMRDRLERLVGRAAYDVQISTYHAFGGEIFRRYPDYFDGAELSLIEDLGLDGLLREIISRLPYTNPLKFADNYINDIKSFISEAKRALLSPKDIDSIAEDNLKFIRLINRQCRPSLDKITTVSKKTVPVFDELQSAIAAYQAEPVANVLSLARYAQAELESALEYFSQSGKTTQLTEWKRHWLAKDEDGSFIFDGQRLNDRLKAAAGIYRRYQQELKSRKLYDYDDMIIKAIDLLETNKDLKYSLAEQYSYIMLDEFQDTNAAQFKLVELLSDHPVNEGRPNVAAVGDDDQAIYAFQGAEHANMANFVSRYRDVKVISLSENYRAPQELLEVGQNIAAQIQTRLHSQFAGTEKRLQSAGGIAKAKISAREFKSDAAQFQWIAEESKSLIDNGLPAGEIAILAPKHRYLQPLLPYLAAQNLAVRYERRENILDEPIIRQLEQMSRLVIALAAGNETLANAIWPEVLSYDFWQIPTDKIWRISWQSRESHEPWTALVLNDDEIGYIAALLLRLAALLPLTSLEEQLDSLIGLPETADKLKLPSRSPMYEYYFSKKASLKEPLNFNKLISDLNVLRSRLREWRRQSADPLGLRVLVEFIDGHRAANLNILNTSPYYEAGQAINLLTAYGSKGREFQAVFIIAASDEVWGSASRNQGYRLALPANLSYIRYQGASEDERLRLLFVASTRPRARLYFTSYRQDMAGRRLTRLKYLDISEDDGVLKARILPPPFQEIEQDDLDSLNIQTAISYWAGRHVPPFKPSLEEVLAPKLAAYTLNATHLNKFTDIVNGGPDKFFMDCLLRFPSAPTTTSAFGTAIHNSLRFAGNILASEGKLPSAKRLYEIFDAQLGRIELASEELENLRQRGYDSLRIWLDQSGRQLNPTDKFEYNFRGEAASLGEARLSGTIDRMIVDEKRRKITIIDYKTGQSYRRWQAGVIKLHKFRQQLNFYKLLSESSARFRKYEVEKAYIEFVEPDEAGRINRLEYNFDKAELDKTTRLIGAVWRHIQTLDFPDVSQYQPSLAGIRDFEKDLLVQQKTPDEPALSVKQIS